MRMRFPAALTVGAVALFSASTAIAQENTEDQWTGPYIGGSFGLGAQGNNGGETLEFDTNRDGRFGDTVRNVLGHDTFATGFCRGQALGATPDTCRSNKDGIEYFARAGYDKQMGNIVVGVMGEFGKANIRDSVSALSTSDFNYVYNREFDWQSSIRGRAGYAAKGALFYVAGGPAYARINHSFSSSSPNNSFTLTGDRNVWGVTGGGGVEIKATRNISFGLEYMYSRYNDNDSRVAVGPVPAGAGSPVENPFLIVDQSGSDIRRSDNRFDYHGIRATAAFRF